jgi:hypothetical protein
MFNVVLMTTAHCTRPASALRRVVLREDVTLIMEAVKVHVRSESRFKLYIL